jgi:hypothetical protein
MRFARLRSFPAGLQSPPAARPDKLDGLPVDQALLQPSQNRSDFGQGEPERLGLQAAALQMSHLLDHFGLTLV